MTSFADAIRTFQRGGLSDNEFLAQVDRALANDRTSPSRLLAVLDEENTNIPLPPNLYAEVQQRIRFFQDDKNGADDTTRIKAAPIQQSTSRQAIFTNPLTLGGEGGRPERVKGVGDTLNGRFVLEECLGFGGMGMVYKALDLRKQEASDRNPYIAIKVINVQFRGHPQSLIALQREAKKAQKLAHPNIVTVYDFDRDGSTVYLTMEYLEGKPLSQILRAPDFKSMSWRRASFIVTGIATALEYAHRRGFVHCDLKPANVFVTDSGEVKVIDFGISRGFHRPDQESEATVFDAGSLGGLTPAYASPEMIENQDPDPRDDIYALACITYELLTGRHPFNRLPATQARNAGMKPARPKELGSRQWRALRRALCFDRKERTPTVKEFIQEMSDDGHAMVTYGALAGGGLLVAGLVAGAFQYFLAARPGHEKESVQVASGAGVQGPKRDDSIDVSRPPGQAPSSAKPSAPVPSPPPAKPLPAKPPPAAPSLDALMPVLAKVPCSALYPSLKDNVLEVRGYLSKDYGTSRLQQTLGSTPGIQSVKVNAEPVNKNYCGIVEAFAPFWVGNRLAGGGTSIRTKAPRGEMTEGDPLIVNITTPKYRPYIYIDYYALDGNVMHMVPGPVIQDNQAPRNNAATIGGHGKWVISSPFGTEMVAILTTPIPLFDGQRPESEPRSGYLQAVQDRLRDIEGKYGNDKITADFVQITTKPRKP